jgi:hypothetical protein
MNKTIADILAITFILILLGSLGVFIYNVFNNTPYPDDSESLTDNDPVNIQDHQDLTQLTLESMQQNMTELPGGYLLPPPRTKFQCLLPSLNA